MCFSGPELGRAAAPIALASAESRPVLKGGAMSTPMCAVGTRFFLAVAAGSSASAARASVGHTPNPTGPLLCPNATRATPPQASAIGAVLRLPADAEPAHLGGARTDGKGYLVHLCTAPPAPTKPQAGSSVMSEQQLLRTREC